jgi:hypothetical protein
VAYFVMRNVGEVNAEAEMTEATRRRTRGKEVILSNFSL